MGPAAAGEAARMLRVPQGGQAPETWWADSLDLFAEERLRHYLTVRVGSWGDEVVLTVFSRVQMQGGLLFLESRAFLLPPIARAYHRIDDILPPRDLRGWAELVGPASTSVFSAVTDSLSDLLAPSRTKARTARSRHWYERMCATDRPVDHGPAYSIRELAAEPRFQQLFQEMDVSRFLTSIRTRTLTAVRNSLRDAGYRTSEYDARTTVLLDRSVHIGGAVHGNVQTGDNSTAEFVAHAPARAEDEEPEEVVRLRAAVEELRARIRALDPAELPDTEGSAAESALAEVEDSLPGADEAGQGRVRNAIFTVIGALASVASLSESVRALREAAAPWF
ncbi:DUF5955 family protein [Streptomyces pratensis]|uniref:DUF5955 family protein n=1 Tax=Streptomyces pratensis TaxID=1169025 RepID=UPI0037B09C53